jgi:hypothetical protein
VKSYLTPTPHDDDLSSVEKGRIATAEVMAVLTSRRIEVYAPVLDNGSCDLIAVGSLGVRRIEVKYASQFEDSGSVTASLRQTRHNSSGFKSKKFDATQCELLALYIAPWDAVMLFPAEQLHGASAVTCSEAHARLGSWK